MSAVEMIPVVLFAYARPAHLRRALACWRGEKVPLMYAFADGAKGAADAAAVAEVRQILREVDWCEIRIVERPVNLGLGQNVLDGVGSVARAHAMFVVAEDDLVFVPGTYAWMCAALRRYENDGRVMSVSAWTHPRVTPGDVGSVPYFDARAECWIWGAYGRSWRGMERTALAKRAMVEARGFARDAYGADLPAMAAAEARKNIWAVRWLYHHLESGGLCLRPPWSLVEHIGFDAQASNAAEAKRWANPPLRPVPPIPARWPEAQEHGQCGTLWRAANPRPTGIERLRARGGSVSRRVWRSGRALAKAMVPAVIRDRLRPLWAWKWFRGDFRNWAAARAASGGYDEAAILNRVLESTLMVRAGQAAFERDGVLFDTRVDDQGLMRVFETLAGSINSGLRVLDFGGSLGSTYWRHSEALLARGVVWDVVEQGAFVEAGRKYLGTGPVRFFFDVHEAERTSPHDVLLCSCVLQYLENPFVALREWATLEIPYVVLNNVPLHRDGDDRLRVQHVPAAIYRASYPVWFFNREKFLARVRVDYDVIEEFPSEAAWPVDGAMYVSTGFLLRRKRGVESGVKVTGA